MKVYIYALRDPQTNAVRYIGKAVNVKRRVQGHLCPASLRRKRHVARWLSGLVARGLRPTIEVLRVSDSTHWQDDERELIAAFRKRGANLCNILDGGEGGATFGRRGSKWTKQQHERYKKTRIGMKIASPSLETRKRRGEAIRAHWDALRERGIRKRGPKHTAATRMRLSRAHKGKTLSSAHRKKLSVAKLGVTKLQRAIRDLTTLETALRKEGCL